MRTNYFNALTLLLCLFLATAIHAQKPKKLAADYFKSQNYLLALPQYQLLLKEEALNVEFATNAAICILETNMDRSQAIPILENLIENQVIDGKAVFLLAKAYTFKYNFEKSTNLLEQHRNIIPEEYKAAAEKMIENNRTAVALMQNPVNVEFENLGKKINSPFPDYYPYVVEDESTLVFTSRRKKSGAVVEFDGYYNSDIYMVQNFNQLYPKVKNAGALVNTHFDEQVVGLSKDGLQMMVYIDHVDVFGDIYVSNWQSTKYMKIQKLGVNVNGEDLETSASFSDDGNTLFFASNKPGGFGGLDLYMSRKLPNGSWGKSQNLGPKVNTSGDEDFPFLAKGNQLYFSSDGHPGMGGYDLHVTQWNPESNEWGKVKNLGYPINTPDDNRTITFNKSGSHAYVSMYRKDGYGDLDIYKVIFSDQAVQPAMLEVELFEKGSENKLQDDIVILDSDDNIYGIYRPKQNSGKYIIPLVPGKYNISVESDGFQEFYKELVVLGSEVDGNIHPKKFFLTKQ